MAEAVKALGHECATAMDGQEAWAMHQSAAFDVIISDWNMPKVSGLELCTRTRKSDGNSYTYFILMTGMSEKKYFLTGMDAGADDYITKPLDFEELEARLKSAQRVTNLHRELASNNVRLRRDSEHFFSVAHTDALTQTGNRLRLDEDLRSFEARRERYSHRYCVAMCDVDFFKQYNDSYGHVAGDHVLREISDCMRKALRSGDQLYRYGGEEFCVILPEQSIEEAAQVMERVRDAVQKLNLTQANTVNGCVTVSIGVAAADAAAETPEECIKRADTALYSAKKLGRNRVEIDSAASLKSP